MARYEKYETKKGIRWKYIVETGVNPQTGKRKRIVKRGFAKERDAKKRHWRLNINSIVEILSLKKMYPLFNSHNNGIQHIRLLLNDL